MVFFLEPSGNTKLLQLVSYFCSPPPTEKKKLDDGLFRGQGRPEGQPGEHAQGGGAHDLLRGAQGEWEGGIVKWDKQETFFL